MNPVALALGFAADRVLGDPQRLHPVAGFGQAADHLEAAVWRPSRAVGALYAVALVAAVVAPVSVLDHRLRRCPRMRTGFGAAVVWLCLGGRSLELAVVALTDAVAVGDLARARELAPTLVGRDPRALDADGLLAAAIESLGENTSDAVVATLLWAAALGPAGAAAHRVINTLDAMVGHRTPRHAAFGWVAAHADDIANWPAARLTAAVVAVFAGPPRAQAGDIWRWARDRGRRHPSPNAGLVEAAFAAALGLRLGGTTVYPHGSDPRPTFDAGHDPTVADVHRAVTLAGATQAVCLCMSMAVAAGARG